MAKKFTAVPFLSLSHRELELLSLFTEGQSESRAKKRMEGAKRVGPLRLQSVMHFRLILDQTIREEMADLVNSGPQWTHFG